MPRDMNRAESPALWPQCDPVGQLVKVELKARQTNLVEDETCGVSFD